ncbi:hypothetical protein H1C71_009887 [Ictidomys tridecemlineatus]|nr:hypothetical protein H1C71_009887 [Ictidomys tridecemlineatus]
MYSLRIPTVPLGHSGEWGVAVLEFSPSCPEESGQAAEAADKQPGLIPAAVCSSLAGPIQDFLQKYHFTAAGWLDSANCLTLLHRKLQQVEPGQPKQTHPMLLKID